MHLPEMQFNVLRAVANAGTSELTELARALAADQSPVAAACLALQDAGYLSVRESEFDEFRLGPDAEPFAAAPLPERVIVGVLKAAGGRCRITDIPSHCPLNAGQVGQSLRLLAQRGWARKEADTLVLLDGFSEAAQPDEALIRALAGGRVARREQLAAQGVDVAAAAELLKPRKGFLVVKGRTDRRAELTDAGRALLAAGVSARRSVTQLTPDLLADGGWRQVELQPYDVTLAARTLYPGKEHAFQRTLEKVRRVFLEMGFTEIVSPWVESSFWDFDALFQPQDHPARDMQDTFYVARPARTQLPDDQLVERIRRTHEDGGDTGSTGWRYRWSREMAHKPVLRTHTTAATIRALAAHARPTAARPLAPSAPSPGKYFVIGPVYRRETVDYKHLPVFHQVDGIVVDPHASLATLLGTLAAFYGKMGFPKVRFRPSFFPYTEPSAEVFLYLEHRQEWVEMGGSGIFRPEVTLPLGIRDRVLAWGLGLERLAMMIHNLKSIGDLYFATMPWLREAPLSRA
ncbi:MAG: Phenylalanine--tRNA ligase alpha subunit [Phycisphaerae bacterium]|nr:Phenylalanine--tRNA ligase alpha subunit [Phycisphaerae bacterium]